MFSYKVWIQGNSYVEKKNYFRKQGYQKALIHVTGKYLVFQGSFRFRVFGSFCFGGWLNCVFLGSNKQQMHNYT